MENHPGILERLGEGLDGTRTFLRRGWRILLLLLKLSYLLSERRRLLEQLGTWVFEKTCDASHPEYQRLLQRLERVSKKIELEHRVIEHIRTGSKIRPSKEGT